MEGEARTIADVPAHGFGKEGAEEEHVVGETVKVCEDTHPVEGQRERGDSVEAEAVEREKGMADRRRSIKEAIESQERERFSRIWSDVGEQAAREGERRESVKEIREMEEEEKLRRVWSDIGFEAAQRSKGLSRKEVIELEETERYHRMWQNASFAAAAAASKQFASESNDDEIRVKASLHIFPAAVNESILEFSLKWMILLILVIFEGGRLIFSNIYQLYLQDVFEPYFVAFCDAVIYRMEDWKRVVDEHISRCSDS